MILAALKHWKLLLGGLAVVLLLGFIGVQKYQISARDATIERKDVALGKAARDLRTAEMNLLACSGAIDRQNAAVRALGAAGVESTRRQVNALRDARRDNERATEAVGRIRARKISGCETGREIMGAGL